MYRWVGRCKSENRTHSKFAPLDNRTLHFCPAPEISPPSWCINDVYCRMPARWGLRQTTLAPGSDKTRAQGSFGPLTDGQNLTKSVSP